MVKLPNHVLLSRRVHYNCCHTPPHIGLVGTSASTAYIGPSSTAQMQYNMTPAVVEDIPPCLPDEEQVSLLDHTEDSVQRHYLSDVGHESEDLDSDLGRANPQRCNAGCPRALGCPCGVPRCKGKHADILEPRQKAYQHLWASLPEHVYEGIIKHLD